MPILPPGTKKPALEVGGSPRGWSFIGTGLSCWRKWAFKYLVGLNPAATKDYFDLGSAYHALMEGRGTSEVMRMYPNHIEAAVELQQARLKKGPPLSEALAVEREHILFNGKMTSKPDREEEGRIRDFKTAMTFSDNDEAAWNVDPGILGECLAAGVSEGIVDIVSKRVDSDKRVKLVTVKLTAEKVHALQSMVNDFWETLERRVKKAAGSPVPAAPNAFPMALNACVGKYGKCDYYDRCHGKPPESMLYRLSETPPRLWMTGRGESPLPLPGKLTPSLIEKATGKVRAAWWPKGKSTVPPKPA